MRAANVGALCEAVALADVRPHTEAQRQAQGGRVRPMTPRDGL